MSTPNRSTAILLTLFALTGCRFDYRTPTGARNEDPVLQGLPVAFYRALARHDSAAFGRAVFPAATVLIDGGNNPATLVAARALLGIPEYRTERSGVRLVRSEVRADGNLATVRVVIAADGTLGAGDFEANDFLTLARRDGAWRIAHAVFGPWRPRSAP
ncbi:MAG: nuclear transport factor 2 family protein [Gemmatimonadota bacterium]